ncbi:MAG: polyphosphate polymerase domain-containing protein [Clostridia bacterium]|nr:polyphosphate polymerase domain-containing protein [Clostridia bacterium]
MKSDIKCIFQRTEKKYLLTEKQYNLLLEKTKKSIKADKYGITSICNIYFDTDDNELIRTSIEKPLYKEKLRLRSYGTPDSDESKVFLEIKKKFDGVVYKRRAAMTFKESEDYLNNGVKPSESGQIINEIDYIIGHYNLKPKLFLAYDRIAYNGIEDDELRITFDKNIRSRENDLSLKSGSYGTNLLDSNTYLMEIKANGGMPLWLADLLSELEIYPMSFSKYGNIYKKSLMDKSNINLKKFESII